jgi:hypothetical protein
MTGSLRLSGVWLAPAAQTWLQTTQQARLLHLFARTCNLINQNGALLTLAQADIGPAPFSLTVAANPAPIRWTDLLSSHSPVSLQADQLRLGPIQIDTSSARLWSPQPNWVGLQNNPSWRQLYRPLWQQMLAAWVPEQGLMAVGQRPFTQQLDQLAQALHTADITAAVRATRHLAGLGLGLTPAGDDALMGALYGLWATRPAEQVRPLAQAVVQAAAPQTTSLSAAWLQAAARGEAAVVWHHLVEALGGGRETAVQQTSYQILRTGHSSGHDALTGFIAII